MRGFKTKKGCTSHLRTARSCSWYRQGKLADLAPLDLDGEGGHMQIVDDGGEMQGYDNSLGNDEPSDLEEMDQDAQDVMDEIAQNDNLFNFIPIPPPTQIGEAGPGPSTVAARNAQRRLLDDHDDC